MPNVLWENGNIMDFKEDFKNNLKQKTKGMDFGPSPSKLFEKLSEQIESEIEHNPVLKFKKTISEHRKEQKLQTNSPADFFKLLEETKQESSKDEIITSLVEEKDIHVSIDQTEIFHSEEHIEDSITTDLIALSIDSISKEESVKSIKEITNLFSEPNVNKPDPNIRALQNKLKMLEDWVSKISMAGPGGGEVNFRYLDDVNSGSIGENKYLTYNQDNRKFYFDYITSNTIVNNTTVVTSNTYSLVSTDYYVGVNSPEATTIFLQTTAQEGKIIVIKDESGNCSTNPISVVGNVDNDIGGFILKIDNGAVQMVYRNGWRII
jgi:hypothetical protein